MRRSWCLLFCDISCCCRYIICFSIEIFRNEIPVNILYIEENIDNTIECFTSFLFVEVTSVAINRIFYIHHTYVRTVNVKLTTASLVINLLHFQVFRSWDANLQLQKRALDSNPTQFLSSDLPCSEHPAILIDTKITWSPSYPYLVSASCLAEMCADLYQLGQGNSSSEDFQ